MTAPATRGRLSAKVAGVATGVEPGTPPEGVQGVSVQSEPTTPVSAWAAIDPRQRRPVLQFFLAVVLSVYGDWLSTVALVVILFEATHSPAGPAGYVLARVAPRAIGPWLGGNLADRLSPQRMMVLASVVQALFTVSFIVSHRAGAVWAIYVAVAAAQFAGGLSRPSQGALLPSLVSHASLSRANATYSLFGSTSIFVGPAIGAALLLRVGPDPLFAIDAASFAISSVLIGTLPRAVGRARPSSVRSSRTASTSGALIALRNPQIRIVAAGNFVSGLTVTVAQALLVVAAHERLGSDASVGYLYASVGVGGTLGGLIALRWVPPRRWTRFAVFAAVIVELVSLAGFTAAAGIEVGLLLLALNSAGGTSMDTWGATEVQRLAPAGSQGRFNSVIFMSLYAGMVVGAIWALSTASILHWDVAIEYACAASLVIIAAVWISCGKTEAQPGPKTSEP